MSEVVVKILNEDGSPKTPEIIEQERQEIISAGNVPIVPGSATDHGYLLGSLQEARQKTKDLEIELAKIKNSPPSASDPLTVETLQGEIQESNKKIFELTQENLRQSLIKTYPILEEKWAEFQTFYSIPENAGMNLNTAAKVFLVDNGLLSGRRKGLENPTGGSKVAPSTGMTLEDITYLRENNPKKYTEMLQKGQIKVPS